MQQLLIPHLPPAIKFCFDLVAARLRLPRFLEECLALASLLQRQRPNVFIDGVLEGPQHLVDDTPIGGPVEQGLNQQVFAMVREALPEAHVTFFHHVFQTGRRHDALVHVMRLFVGWPPVANGPTIDLMKHWRARRMEWVLLLAV